MKRSNTPSVVLAAQIFTALALPFTHSAPVQAQTSNGTSVTLNNKNGQHADEYYNIQTHAYYGNEAPGSLIVAQGERRIYFIMPDGKTARSYPISVGRPGFELRIGSEFTVGVKQVWPQWRPTARMRRENPRLPEVMRGGPHNPLGSRRLVFYDDGGWTVYGAHGTNDPSSIGKNKSSGCVRLFNPHIEDLYLRVETGAPAKVVNHMDLGQAPIANIQWDNFAPAWSNFRGSFTIE